MSRGAAANKPKLSSPSISKELKYEEIELQYIIMKMVLKRSGEVQAGTSDMCTGKQVEIMIWNRIRDHVDEYWKTFNMF